jgi:hypothetical protein
MITTNTAEESAMQIKLADELFSIPYTKVQKRLIGRLICIKAINMTVMGIGSIESPKDQDELLQWALKEYSSVYYGIIRRYINFYSTDEKVAYEINYDGTPKELRHEVDRKFTEKLVNHIEHSITELERNGISRQMYEQLWATMPDFYSVKLRDGYLVESNPLESLLRVDNGGEFRAY